mmetsp:Transcript_9592/g.28637  ORF Transcript_9592/g.28637 Transcript_9592/m.28637 type:complete len:108 (-) Transcript_9592:102-425(-)
MATLSSPPRGTRSTDRRVRVRVLSLSCRRVFCVPGSGDRGSLPRQPRHASMEDMTITADSKTATNLVLVPGAAIAIAIGEIADTYLVVIVRLCDSSSKIHNPLCYNC